MTSKSVVFIDVQVYPLFTCNLTIFDSTGSGMMLTSIRIHRIVLIDKPRALKFIACSESLHPLSLLSAYFQPTADSSVKYSTLQWCCHGHFVQFIV